jgi:SAM-dependent methyltransferase
MVPKMCYILAPHVPTPSDVADRMLQIAALTDEDVVYDLGCGDGRIVIAAAKGYGARGVGVDIEPYWVEQSLANAQAAKVSALVRFEHQDAMSVDLRAATVITLYLMHWSMQLLAPLIVERANLGTRVVSHNFAVEGWEPVRMESFTDARGDTHRLYLWIIGPHVTPRLGPARV